jgi:hypothetical protein
MKRKLPDHLATETRHLMPLHNAMRGTDCTHEQLAAASHFLELAGWTEPPVTLCSRDDIVRLLAWYASLMFGADEQPGTIVVARKEQL